MRECKRIGSHERPSKDDYNLVSLIVYSNITLSVGDEVEKLPEDGTQQTNEGASTLPNTYRRNKACVIGAPMLKKRVGSRCMSHVVHQIVVRG